MSGSLLADLPHELITLLTDWLAGPGMVPFVLSAQPGRSLDSLWFSFYNVGDVITYTKSIETFVDGALCDAAKVLR